MANLQYIGARYVPKIYKNSINPESYAWEENTAYEALVMVSYRNTSYISRIPVPATVGDPATNSDYWCSMGSFSAQVQEYINIVAGLQDDVEDFSTDLADATAALNAAIQTSLNDSKTYTDNKITDSEADTTAAINSAKSDLEAADTALAARITALEGGKVEKAILIGNSHAAGSGGTAGRGWPYYFQQFTGIDSHIIAQNGGDFYDVGNSSADYPDMNYQQALTAYANTLTQAQRESVTLIIYGGGLNDKEGTYNQVKTRVVNCLNAMKNTFPNARQIVVPTSGTWYGEAGTVFPSVPSGGIRLSTCFEAWIDGAGEAGVQVANYSKYWFYHRSEFEGSSADGYHLNAAGYELMGKYIAAVYNGADFAWIPYSGGQSYPAAITGRRQIRAMRSADGIVSITGLIDIPEGEVTAQTIIVDNMGEEFAPITNQFMPAVFYGPTLATRFVCFLTVASSGRIALRGDFGAFGTAGGTVYLNLTYKIDCPQPTFNE